jgi:transcriptional regulator with XRE-family HTH domain
VSDSDQSIRGPEPQELGQRIRELRLARGWGIEALARHAGVSRTTLHNLEKGLTPNPRAGTVKKLAEAFEIAVGELLADRAPAGDGGPRSAVPRTPFAAEQSEAGRRQFDRYTNPTVDEVRAERPRLFLGWSNDNWDELYSEFGIGGPLTPQGVVQAAEAINRKRETLRQLSVVLETELGEVAARMIATLHDMAQASNRLGGPSR